MLGMLRLLGVLRMFGVFLGALASDESQYG
jgi:hypothetical protein